MTSSVNFRSFLQKQTKQSFRPLQLALLCWRRPTPICRPIPRLLRRTLSGDRLFRWVLILEWPRILRWCPINTSSSKNRFSCRPTTATKLCPEPSSSNNICHHLFHQSSSTTSTSEERHHLDPSRTLAEPSSLIFLYSNKRRWCPHRTHRSLWWPPWKTTTYPARNTSSSHHIKIKIPCNNITPRTYTYTLHSLHIIICIYFKIGICITYERSLFLN